MSILTILPKLPKDAPPAERKSRCPASNANSTKFKPTRSTQSDDKGEDGVLGRLMIRRRRRAVWRDFEGFAYFNMGLVRYEDWTVDPVVAGSSPVVLVAGKKIFLCERV